MMTSTTGRLAGSMAGPDCRLPSASEVWLASSGAPGVTTSTDVIVVYRVNELVICSLLR